MQSKGQLTIGNNFFLNSYSRIVCHEEIIIGDNVTIAANVTIIDHDYEMIDDQLVLKGFSCKPISIGSNVWIGEKAIILKGVTIGDNTVVAAGSIVTKNIVGNVVVAGAPAKTLRELE